MVDMDIVSVLYGIKKNGNEIAYTGRTSRPTLLGRVLGETCVVTSLTLIAP